MFKFKKLFFATLFLMAMNSSAFASMSCQFDNVPNGGGPDTGAVRHDLFKFSGLNADSDDLSQVGAYWTPFFNLGTETQNLVVTSFARFRCPNCYEVIAKTAGEGQVIEFKISINGSLMQTIEADVQYRVNVGGPSEWVAFSDKPGVCSVTNDEVR